MTTKWTPIYGDFDCPGRMILSADKHGITIRTRRKALGTTEWPGETIRLCEVLYVIEDDVPVEAIQLLIDGYRHDFSTEAMKAIPVVQEWLDSMSKESKK